MGTSYLMNCFEKKRKSECCGVVLWKHRCGVLLKKRQQMLRSRCSRKHCIRCIVSKKRKKWELRNGCYGNIAFGELFRKKEQKWILRSACYENTVSVELSFFRNNSTNTMFSSYPPRNIHFFFFVETIRWIRRSHNTQTVRIYGLINFPHWPRTIEKNLCETGWASKYSPYFPTKDFRVWQKVS